MAKNYYAIRVGRKTGIFTDVDEYLSYTRGFPNAECRGFKTLEKAEEFLRAPVENEAEDKTIKLTPDMIVSAKLTAYVDGSFHHKSGRASYGIVICGGKKEIYISNEVKEQIFLESCNAGAELKAAIEALQYAKANYCKSITIIHDFRCISEIALGQCKAKGCAKEYKRVYDEVSKTVSVHFRKVKSHSSNSEKEQKYNNLADALARGALSLKVKKSLQEHINQALMNTNKETVVA